MKPKMEPSGNGENRLTLTLSTGYEVELDLMLGQALCIWHGH
jgi:hypothetical protein